MILQKMLNLGPMPPVAAATSGKKSPSSICSTLALYSFFFLQLVDSEEVIKFLTLVGLCVRCQHSYIKKIIAPFRGKAPDSHVGAGVV